MDSWYQKLLDDNGNKDLTRAENLDVDELRTWLSDHFEGADPSVARNPDMDPVELFEEVWEGVPSEAFRRRLNEAIELDFQDCAKAPEKCVDYLAFILRLMTYLPLSSFPSHSVWRLYRTQEVAELRSAGGPTLDRFLIQALFARGAVSPSEQVELLRKRGTANLAYSAICKTGIGPAVARLPVLLATLTEPVDDVAIISHLKMLESRYGPKDLVDRITSARSEWNPEHWDRLERFRKNAEFIDGERIDREEKRRSGLGFVIEPIVDKPRIA